MSYRDELLRAIASWNADPIDDEWIFASFRRDRVETMSPSEAFDSVAETLEILLNEPNESTAIEILETVIALARQSDTTEVPAALSDNRSALQAKILAFQEYAGYKLRELFAYYRM